MRNITPLQNKLGLIDPEDVMNHVANGGSLEDLANQYEIRYSDLYRYITSREGGEAALELAFKAAEHRDRDLVVRSLRSIIQTSPTDCFEEDGTLKPVSEWPRELIAGFEVEELMGKTEQIGNVKKMKSIDRLKAIEMLGKERGMFVQKQKVEHTLTLEELVAQSNKISSKPSDIDITGANDA